MLTPTYEIKNKFILFFEALEKQNLLLSIKLRVLFVTGKSCGYCGYISVK